MIAVLLASTAAGLAVEMPASLMGDFAALNEMLAQLEQQMPSPRVAAPPNPCMEDMRRLQCSDPGCLRQAADELSPTCAAFLIGEPEPSPAPLVRERPMTGFFSVTTSNGNGDIIEMSGPMSPRGMPGMMPSLMGILSSMNEDNEPMPALFPPQLASVLPPEVLAMLSNGAGPRGPSREEENDDQAMHPCGPYIGACMRETGRSDRQSIEDCLVAHLDQLSADCKCFVHQTVASAAKGAHATAPTAAAPTAVQFAPDVIVVDRPMPPVHPLHRLSCLFFFTALFLLSLMATRALVAACCTPRAKHVVMVPPESAIITAITPQKKKQRAVATVPMPTAAEVQVAEPLSKA